VLVDAAALVPRGAIVESPSFAAPADDDAAPGPGAVVAADDDGELADDDAFVDDGVADCAAALAPVAGELESAAWASVAPAMPIVETINADTSLLLNGEIMVALLEEDGRGSRIGAAGTHSLLQGICHGKPLIRRGLLARSGHPVPYSM
jgi:hypothetical protein